ncbi:NnrS family protein [Pseudophaeobacter flagellatus]|uniref:NnrS family protein n=1 Tax=Pseudophaeobacter flagellatus TaxID=2899119 RepID=UPI001E4C1FD8|nr:NnrS family protein [Pseudophaeobacter flagellatus]MCD9149055.1 NnrS family protein [Pseudophaeobacter flagellatus]
MAAPHSALFLAGGTWAIVAVALVSWNTGFEIPQSPLGSLVAWHAHEMVFGFAAAMFAGYALTAMTSWRDKPTLSRLALTVLLSLWCLARIIAAGLLGSAPALVAGGASAFMVAVAWLLLRAAFDAASSKGAVIGLFALAMAGAQIATLSGAIPSRIPVLGFAALLSVIGGRMVAAFTWNRVAGSRDVGQRFKVARLASVPAAGAILLALALETLGAPWQALLPCLLLAAAAEALRLLLWLSAQTLKDGLLGLLHMGYAWLPLGLFLAVLSTIPGAILAKSDTIHALAAGAIAGSIYAVAARAVARRADRLCPSLIDIGGGVLLSAAAALRVFAQIDTVWYAAAPAIWCTAWAAFVLRQGTAALQPLPRPVFSGKKCPTCGIPDQKQHKTTVKYYKR